MHESDADVVALGDVDAGDALSMATRFDRQWAYCGDHALLWKRRLGARSAQSRRSLLHVDADCDGTRLHLFATRFSADRTRIRDLRFTRAAVRAVRGTVILFAGYFMPGRVGFSDLGLCVVQELEAPELAIAARGYDLSLLRLTHPAGGIGPALLVCATRPASARLDGGGI
ncbi:MAG TPA: hypothetical protein VNG31_01540 [Candidatus Baltobacteraceae bacterium]|nr:hypothetical protein [Candidatus Baltobacteraceae bacterium]